jgi:hypothetical protein
MKTNRSLVLSARASLLAAGVLIAWAFSSAAQTTPPLGQPRAFWSAAHPEWPPFPEPPPGVTAQLLGVTADGAWEFVLQDLGFPYPATLSPSRAMSDDQSLPPLPGDGGTGGYDDWKGGGWPQPSYNLATDFILDIAVTNNLAWLTAYNVWSNYFQIQSLTHVPGLPGEQWAIEKQYNGVTGSVVTLDPIPVDGVPAKFFRGAESDTLVGILHGADAVEPWIHPDWRTTPATFTIYRVNPSGDYPQPLTVYYTLGGSAIPGQTYSNLSGSVTFQVNESSRRVDIVPLVDDLVRSNTTMVLSLVITNSYLVDSNYASAMILIKDNPFHVVATNIYQPATVACEAISNALLVSYNLPDGLPYNFAQIPTNTVTVTNSDNSLLTRAALTNWPGVVGLSNLYVLAVATAPAGQPTNAAGFTNGDIFFNADTPGVLSWVSANGSNYVSTWVILPGDGTNSETNYVRGGLAFDQSGVYGGDLLVATGSSDGMPYEACPQNIYCVHSDRTVRWIATINAEFTKSLAGVCAVPNDPDRYHYLAGKIITADQNYNAVWAADTNGAAYPNGAAYHYWGYPNMADLHIIPANQDFYVTGSVYWNCLFKVSRLYFQDYVGDLLLTREDGTLSILEWDPEIGDFNIVSNLTCPTEGYPDFELGAFASFPIPLISPQP